MAVDYNKLGNCIENIYNNQAIDASRKVVSTLRGETLSLRFVTIKEFAREVDKDSQTKLMEDEAVKCINSRVKEIKECYKDLSGKTIKLTPIKSVKPMSCEVMTTSPFSIRRTYKVNYIVSYTLS